MRTVSAIAVAAGLGIAALATPLEAANREHEQLMADIRMLQEQTQQLQVLLGTLADSIRAVNTRLDESEAAERKALADQKLLVDNLSGDLRVVREKVDETNVRIASLSQDVEGIRDLIPPPGAMPAPVPSPDGTTTPGSTPDGTAGTPPPDAAPTGPMALGMSPRRLYDQAFADYAAGQYSIAISGFEMYLKTYPKSDQADDAQYYIGKSHSNAQSHKDAVMAYQRLIQSYPDSNQLPEAWYQLGLSYDNLGQPDRARAAFEHLVKNFPDSDPAGLAKQRLERPVR